MDGSAYTLTLRSLPKGGEPVLPKEDEFAKLNLCRYRRLLLLIHGYNNDRSAADEAYDGFEKLQQKLAGDPANGDYAPGTHTIRVYWPGDADWGLASALFFMHAIDHAEKSGALLAETLERLAADGPLWVDVVAHSLGCRVTYEMLAALSDNTNVHIHRIVLFAAAVATFMLEPKDGQGFDTAYYARGTEGLLSLYSGHDSVLSLAFPVGSTMSPGPQGSFPTALGHEFWASLDTPLTVNQAENRNAGHSDYWGWDKKTKDTIGRFANQAARDYLRFATVARRQMPVVDALVRTGEAARKTAVRKVAEREAALRRLYGWE